MWILVCGRLRSQQESKAPDVLQPTFDQLEPTDCEIRRGDVIRPLPELVQKIVNAQKLGLLYVRNHGAEDIANLILSRDDIASHLGNIDRPTLVSVLEKIKANFGTGALDRRGYEIQMNVYTATGVLDRAVSFDEATDWTFAGVTP